ncbi:MAG: hypothetical protein AAFO82_09730 [Bacteroidota bacterium]
MNEQGLKNTIQNLPQYQAPEQLWQRIETDLELQNVIAKLPTYAPKDQVWTRIEEELPAKRVRLTPRYWMSAAAAVAILVVAVFWWQNQQNQPDIALIESVDTQKVELLLADWNEDEDAFEKMKSLCTQYPFLCTNENFQSLENELEELEEAKSAVTFTIQKYGKQARLVHQIKAIEQERSEVLKQMIAMI